MFLNIGIAAGMLNLHRLEVEKRRAFLESLSPEGRASYLALDENLRIESVAERRHRELCASIEKAGKNACFW